MSVLRKILIVTVLACLLFTVLGCQTSIGIFKDLGDGARGVENLLKPLEKCREQDRVEEAARIVLENEKNEN